MPDPVSLLSTAYRDLSAVLSSLTLEEGFEPWVVSEMYLATANTPDVFVDITDTFERKLDALRCHASQMTDLDTLDARIRSWNTLNAERAGLPAGRLAESYLRVDTQ